MSTNRRDFLKKSGLALAGLAGVSGLAATAEAAAPTPAAPASPGAGSIERWLLETGRNKIDDDVYLAVAHGKL
ncbi:MAG TPA: twin-arginine translocation signal domain-containing protein [Thermoanaerobaculia bacterium]